MTGRENTYMNGATMGMGRSEITRKLDEIVDLANKNATWTIAEKDSTIEHNTSGESTGDSLR